MTLFATNLNRPSSHDLARPSRSLHGHQLRDLAIALNRAKLTFCQRKPAGDPQFHVVAVPLLHPSPFLLHHRVSVAKILGSAQIKPGSPFWRMSGSSVKVANLGIHQLKENIIRGNSVQAHKAYNAPTLTSRARVFGH